MNSIDKRIARLKEKLVPQPRTKKQIFRAEQVEKCLVNQNGCCCICDVEFTGYIKPVPDWADPQHLRLRGLLCNLCYNIVAGARDNLNILNKALYYLKSGGALTLWTEEFKTKPSVPKGISWEKQLKLHEDGK